MKFQKEGKRKNSTKVIEYILRIELIFTSFNEKRNTFNYIERNILGNSIDIKYNGLYNIYMVYMVYINIYMVYIWYIYIWYI